MTWRRRLNNALARTTGVQLRRARPETGASAATHHLRQARGERLVSQPVFILCTLRSGSTLLRVLLDSHSQLHAPHELHLQYVSATLDNKWSRISMREIGLDEQRLKFLLWDRILHRQLTAARKPLIVEKTPNNVFIVDELKACWPDARFIFLLRHPAMIARSREAVLGGPKFDATRNLERIRRYCDALEQVRQRYDGHTIRYEELATEPEAATKAICDFLGVPWEATMLEYGRHDHGRFKIGLGDWAEKIASGTVQPPEPPPPPSEIPALLRPICVKWGYLPSEAAPAYPDSAAAPEPR